ncbi:hypothetical protein PTKIN_Ptkin09bG0071500 [Pterospermum kingtungense]
MKNFSFGFVGPILVSSFLMACLFTESLRVPPHHHHATKFGDEGQVHPEEGVKDVLGMELHPTGSTLPDCSHACGPCFPCKRVMVSFKCSVAESCPIVYRCMCKGKYYHVPSN